jgi:uncharacterized protein YwqG
MADLLEKLASSHGFGAQLDILRKYLLPCAGFSVGLSAAGSVGSSRVGGGPDVPASFEWPSNNDRPLDFILQINLRDVAPHDTAGQFPRAGLLSFFYDLNEQPWGFDPKDLGGHRIFFVPEGATLERRPAAVTDFPLTEAPLGFWPAQSLPNLGSRIGDRLAKEIEAKSGRDVDYDAYNNLSRAVFRANVPVEGPCHRVGGHSENIQGDMQLEAELVTNGLYCGNETGYNDPRAKALEATCEQWTLLLQLDSDDNAGFMWGDMGMLYYWIRSADLARRDFSKSWMALQCG